MKKQWIFIAAIALLAACDNEVDDKSNKAFVIKGKVSATDAKKVYLIKVPASGNEQVLEDSANLGKDGSFVLASNEKESMIFNLVFDQNRYPVASVINDNPEIELEIKLRNNSSEFAEDYTIKNSKASEQMKEYMKRMNNGLMSIYNWSMMADSLAANQNPPTQQPDSLLAISRNEAQALYEHTMSSIIKAEDPALAIFELGYYKYLAEGSPYGLPPIGHDETMDILNKTVERFPNHRAATAIRAETAKAIQDMKEASWIGKQAPDFAMPNVSGQSISLSSFKGKYVLVDFWASWCLPCRKENPNVVNAFNQFKNRNFTILGVSLDKPGEKDKWIKAIQQDRLNWTNISDLSFWNSTVVPMYKIQGIPFNVLVDPKGVIIAENLRGPQLAQTLEAVLPK